MQAPPWLSSVPACIEFITLRDMRHGEHTPNRAFFDTISCAYASFFSAMAVSIRGVWTGVPYHPGRNTEDLIPVYIKFVVKD